MAETEHDVQFDGWCQTCRQWHAEPDDYTDPSPELADEIHRRLVSEIRNADRRRS